MKLNLLETHDRLKYLLKDQSDVIARGCEDCLKRNSLSLRLQARSDYIYIFAHPRTHDNGVDKRMIWQPRLEKPKSQTNSYLFRAKSNTDILEVCWNLPPRELWPQYKKGNVTENEVAIWSINMFMNNREELDRPYPDDVSPEKVRQIYVEIATEIDQEKLQESLASNLINRAFPNLNS